MRFVDPDGIEVGVPDFIGNIVYENGVPAYVNYGEGRMVLKSNGTWFAEIYLKDHLGNIRVAFCRDNGVNKTRQANSYYPFGMNIKELSQYSTDNFKPNEYLYNGKMMQDEMGLGWLDYGARFYDAVLGRWHSVDPLAEKYNDWSPYNYVGANPIKRIDTDGRDWDVVINHDQQTITIEANFKSFAGNEPTLQRSANAWNSQSGKYFYSIGEGESKVSYAINFNITINDGSSNASAENTVSVISDNSKLITEREKTDSDGNKSSPGGLSDGQTFIMKESTKDDAQLTAHEMGHNIGMTDTKGVMNGLGSGKELKSKSVQEVISRSGISDTKVKKNEAQLKQTEVIGSKPANMGSGTIEKNDKWIKKDFVK